MKPTLRLFFFAVILSSVSFFTNIASARTPNATANTFFPVTYSPYLTVYGSQTLQPWRYNYGVFFDYAKRPLEVQLPNSNHLGIVNHLVVGDFGGALGITNWFQVGVSVPVALFEDYYDIVAGTSEKTLRMMDVRLEGKLRLLDIDRHPIGISVVPYVFFPTGAGSRFVGNNGFSGGAKAVFDTNIKNRVQISANLGYFARDRVAVVSTVQDDMFTYGLGVNVSAVENFLDIVTEVHGTTNVKSFFKHQSESPLEADGALRFKLPKPMGMQISVGGGAGLNSGYGAPDFRAIVGITYPNPTHYELALPTPPPPPQPETLAHVEHEQISITRKVHFEYNKAVIRPVSFPILDAITEILKQNSGIIKIRVEGHTDLKGTETYNMKLSQRRANAVREYLIDHGIAANRLIAVGYGKTRPIDSNDTDIGRARNRRVEFVIIEQEGKSSSSSSPQSLE